MRSRKDAPEPLPQPKGAPPWPRDEPMIVETPQGPFVGFPGRPPHLRFALYRPNHYRAVREIRERIESGTAVDLEKDWKRVRNYGLLWVCSPEKNTFTADLYLDSALVAADEVEEIVRSVSAFLDEVLPLAEGVLGVSWSEELAQYEFGVEDET